jgi:hypothetical protein
MRIRRIIAVVAIVLSVAACRKKEVIPAPPAEDIPREVAVNNLGKLLPSSLEVHCTLPKEVLKSTDIQEWVVGNDGYEIRTKKGKSLTLNYADIQSTRLEKAGGKFQLKLFTAVQKESNREHYTFLWATEDNANTADQIFISLIRK